MEEKALTEYEQRLYNYFWNKTQEDDAEMSFIEGYTQSMFAALLTKWIKEYEEAYYKRQGGGK